MPATNEQLRTALASQQRGCWTDAEKIYREVLVREPDHPDAVHLLGMAAQQAGRSDEAMEMLRRAVALDPKASHFHNNLGNALARAGKHKEAVDCFREAIRLRPNYVEAYANLGRALAELQQNAEALGAFDRVIALRKEHVGAHHHRGSALRKLRRLEEAAAAFNTPLVLNPNMPEVYHELAALYGDMGNQAKVIECHSRLAELLPNCAGAGCDLVHVLHYDAGQTREQLFDAAVRWAKVHAEPISARGIRPHGNDRSPERKLRIGYVSPDLHDHPMARLIKPILTHLDREKFSAICYDDCESGDRMTEHLKGLADEWHPVWKMPDDDLAGKIRADRIDILMDMAGHMGGNRLPMFARKPAPIQATQFNYPDTSGMSAMDYRFSDPLAEPPGEADRYSTERLIRLPHCAWCYDPGFDIPEVGPLPAASGGQITFCSLNKPVKHSLATIAVWSKILHAVPNSRLLLLGTDASAENRALRGPFAAHGIHGNRLLFAPRIPRAKYMAIYHDADIALDPFPYNGGITSCDAMWMGVPLVSLAGNSYHSRQGLMLLTNLGLPELIARSEEEYVAIAVRLASDRRRRAELRTSMRQRMMAGHISDGVEFTRDLEKAYREMWRKWWVMTAGDQAGQ